jgi:hypothetical protein
VVFEATGPPVDMTGGPAAFLGTLEVHREQPQTPHGAAMHWSGLMRSAKQLVLKCLPKSIPEGRCPIFASFDPSTAQVDDMGRLNALGVGAMIVVGAACSDVRDAANARDSVPLQAALSTAPAGDVVFFDDFESGELVSRGRGFRWNNSNRASIVRRDGCAVWNNRPIENCGASAFSDTWEGAPESGGNHALRFRYPAGQEEAEQRFTIGSAHPEMWASWWMRVPVNFEHLSVRNPNNKLFMFWMDDYSDKGDGSTVGMEFRPNGEGGSNWYVKVSPGGNVTLRGDQGSTPFIAYPGDQGRWMKIVVRMKAESSEGAADGIVQVWRRWEGQNSFALTHDLNAQPIRLPAEGPRGFSAGYLMGWANSTYGEDTEFLLDNFTLSTTTLLDR